MTEKRLERRCAMSVVRSGFRTPSKAQWLRCPAALKCSRTYVYAPLPMRGTPCPWTWSEVLKPLLFIAIVCSFDAEGGKRFCKRKRHFHVLSPLVVIGLLFLLPGLAGDFIRSITLVHRRNKTPIMVLRLFQSVELWLGIIEQCCQLVIRNVSFQFILNIINI